MALWINGKIVEPTESPLDPTDRGFTLGDGLFETMRYEGGSIRHLDRHMARLRLGAAVLGIELTWTEALITPAAEALARINQLDDGVVRLTLTRGPGMRGLLPPPQPKPTLVLTLQPMQAPMIPACVTISPVTRRNEFSPLSAIKSLNYLDAILARIEARSRGFDDVILLNTQNRVAESSVSSVFAVIDGVLCTPPQQEGALPGVARGLVIEQLNPQICPISLADFARATQVVFTNALGLRAVAKIEGVDLIVGEAYTQIKDALEVRSIPK
jgi:branched-chain amino acid aminotransferase